MSQQQELQQQHRAAENIWESRRDPETNAIFYLNHATRSTSWTLPPNAVLIDGTSSENLGDDKEEVVGESSHNDSNSQRPHRSPADIIEKTSASTSIFYDEYFSTHGMNQNDAAAQNSAAGPSSSAAASSSENIHHPNNSPSSKFSSSSNNNNFLPLMNPSSSPAAEKRQNSHDDDNINNIHDNNNRHQQRDVSRRHIISTSSSIIQHHQLDLSPAEPQQQQQQQQQIQPLTNNPIAANDEGGDPAQLHQLPSIRQAAQHQAAQQQQQQQQWSKWRQAQDQMIHEYLQSAQLNIKANKEILSVKNERIELAEAEWEHLTQYYYDAAAAVAAVQQQQQNYDNQHNQQQQQQQNYPSEAEAAAAIISSSNLPLKNTSAAETSTILQQNSTDYYYYYSAPVPPFHNNNNNNSSPTGAVNTSNNNNNNNNNSSTQAAISTSLSSLNNSNSVVNRFDRELLQAEIEMARKRVEQLKRETSLANHELSTRQIGAQKLAEIKSNLEGRPNGYTLAEKQALAEELDRVKESLMNGERERKELIRSLSNFKDELWNSSNNNNNSGSSSNSNLMKTANRSSSVHQQLPQQPLSSSVNNNNINNNNGSASPSPHTSSTTIPSQLSTNNLSNTDLSSTAADAVCVVPSGVRIAELAKTRLQFDDTKKQLYRLQEQLIRLEEQINPAQLAGDKSELALLYEKEQLLRELKAVAFSEKSPEHHERIQQKIQMLEQDLTHALSIERPEMERRLQLHEKRQGVVCQMYELADEMVTLEQHLVALSANTSALSTCSSDMSVNSSECSMPESLPSPPAYQLVGPAPAGHGGGLIGRFGIGGRSSVGVGGGGVGSRSHSSDVFGVSAGLMMNIYDDVDVVVDDKPRFLGLSQLRERAEQLLGSRIGMMNIDEQRKQEIQQQQQRQQQSSSGLIPQTQQQIQSQTLGLPPSNFPSYLLPNNNNNNQQQQQQLPSAHQQQHQQQQQQQILHQQFLQQQLHLQQQQMQQYLMTSTTTATATTTTTNAPGGGGSHALISRADSESRSAVSAAVSDESMAGDSGVYDGNRLARIQQQQQQQHQNPTSNRPTSTTATKRNVPQISLSLCYSSVESVLSISIDHGRHLAESFGLPTKRGLVSVQGLLLPMNEDEEHLKFWTNWSESVDKPTYKENYNMGILIEDLETKVFQFYLWLQIGMVREVVGHAQLNFGTFEENAMKSYWINILSVKTLPKGSYPAAIFMNDDTQNQTPSEQLVAGVGGGSMDEKKLSVASITSATGNPGGALLDSELEIQSTTELESSTQSSSSSSAAAQPAQPLSGSTNQHTSPFKPPQQQLIAAAAAAASESLSSSETAMNPSKNTPSPAVVPSMTKTGNSQLLLEKASGGGISEGPSSDSSMPKLTPVGRKPIGRNKTSNKRRIQQPAGPSPPSTFHHENNSQQGQQQQNLNQQVAERLTGSPSSAATNNARFSSAEGQGRQQAATTTKNNGRPMSKSATIVGGSGGASSYHLLSSKDNNNTDAGAFSSDESTIISSQTSTLTRNQEPPTAEDEQNPIKPSSSAVLSGFTAASSSCGPEQQNEESSASSSTTEDEDEEEDSEEANDTVRELSTPIGLMSPSSTSRPVSSSSSSTTPATTPSTDGGKGISPSGVVPAGSYTSKIQFPSSSSAVVGCSSSGGAGGDHQSQFAGITSILIKDAEQEVEESRRSAEREVKQKLAAAAAQQQQQQQNQQRHQSSLKHEPENDFVGVVAGEDGDDYEGTLKSPLSSIDTKINNNNSSDEFVSGCPSGSSAAAGRLNRSGSDSSVPPFRRPRFPAFQRNLMERRSLRPSRHSQSTATKTALATSGAMATAGGPTNVLGGGHNAVRVGYYNSNHHNRHNRRTGDPTMDSGRASDLIKSQTSTYYKTHIEHQVDFKTSVDIEIDLQSAKIKLQKQEQELNQLRQIKEQLKKSEAAEQQQSIHVSPPKPQTGGQNWSGSDAAALTEELESLDRYLEADTPAAAVPSGSGAASGVNKNRNSAPARAAAVAQEVSRNLERQQRVTRYLKKSRHQVQKVRASTTPSSTATTDPQQQRRRQTHQQEFFSGGPTFAVVGTSSSGLTVTASTASAGSSGVSGGEAVAVGGITQVEINKPQADQFRKKMNNFITSGRGGRSGVGPTQIRVTPPGESTSDPSTQRQQQQHLTNNNSSPNSTNFITKL